MFKKSRELYIFEANEEYYNGIQSIDMTRISGEPTDNDIADDLPIGKLPFVPHPIPPTSPIRPYDPSNPSESI